MKSYYQKQIQDKRMIIVMGYVTMQLNVNYSTLT